MQIFALMKIDQLNLKLCIRKCIQFCLLTHYTKFTNTDDINDDDDDAINAPFRER